MSKNLLSINTSISDLVPNSPITKALLVSVLLPFASCTTSSGIWEEFDKLDYKTEKLRHDIDSIRNNYPNRIMSNEEQEYIEERKRCLIGDAVDVHKKGMKTWEFRFGKTLGITGDSIGILNQLLSPIQQISPTDKSPTDKVKK